MLSFSKTFLTLVLLTILGFSSKAETWMVMVVNNEFQNSPSTVQVGDTIVWVWQEGFHTTTSLAVPVGAESWNAPMEAPGQFFEYVVMVPGDYSYWCAIHQSMMQASFTALGDEDCPFIPVISPDAVVLCAPGSSATLTASPSGAAYQWFLNGEPILDAFGETFEAIEPGSYEVQVTFEGCTDESGEVMVTMFDEPMNVEVVAENGWIVGDATHVCANDSVTFVLSDPYNVGVQWFVNGNLIPEANVQQYVADQSGIYSVVASTAECPDLMTTSFEFPLVVEDPVMPLISEVAGSLVADAGADMDFQWYLGSDAIPGATDATFTPTEGGIYTVLATTANGCVGLSDPYVFTIGGGDCPFNAAVSPVDLMLCPGSTDTLFASPVGEMFQWYMNGEAITGATNAFYVVSSDSDVLDFFQVAVTIDSCTDMSDSVLVDGWVFNLPFISQSQNGTVIDGITHICAGDTLTLELSYTENVQWFNNGEPIAGANSSVFLAAESGSYTASGAPAECPDYILLQGVPVSLQVDVPTVPVLTLSNDTIYANPMIVPYTWYLNGDPIANESNFFLVATEPGLYNASLVEGQCSAISGPVAYGFVDTCGWEAVITPNTVQLCPNESQTLTVTPGGGAYQWYRDGLPVANAFGEAFTINAITDANANITVIAFTDGCLDTSEALMVNTLSFPAPEVMVTGGTMDSNVVHACEGESITFTLSAPYDTNIQWFNGDPVGTGDSVLVATEGGTYTVSAAPSQCPNYVQTLEPGYIVIFHQPTSPVVTQSNDTLYATASGDGTFQWEMDNDVIAGATNSWYVPNETGSFSVVFTDEFGCDAESDTTNVIVGIEAVEQTSMNIYPNPVADELTIVYNGSLALNFRVTDVTGKVVMEGQCNRSINVSGLATGAYLLSIEDNETIVRTTFLKK